LDNIRVINTDHETLVLADAPLWMTVSYPGGTGVVNLADHGIKKFCDADFPHWTGWRLVDDDKNTTASVTRRSSESYRKRADMKLKATDLYAVFHSSGKKAQ